MWFGEGLDPADPVHDAGGDADSLSPHGRAVFPLSAAASFVRSSALGEQQRERRVRFALSVPLADTFGERSGRTRVALGLPLHFTVMLPPQKYKISSEVKSHGSGRFCTSVRRVLTNVCKGKRSPGCWISHIIKRQTLASPQLHLFRHLGQKECARCASGRSLCWRQNASRDTIIVVENQYWH